MTYNVFGGGTLNLAQSINHFIFTGLLISRTANQPHQMYIAEVGSY